MISAASGSQLAQSRPSGTSAETLFTASMPTEITLLVVANTSGSAATFRVFHDDDGSTYDQTTALYYDVSVAAGASQAISGLFVGGGWHMKKNGTIGIRTGTADALTFTLYGVTAALGAEKR